MRKLLFFLVIIIYTIPGSIAAQGCSISIDSVTNLYNGDLRAGSTHVVSLRLAASCDVADPTYNMTNGFEVWSPDGATVLDIVGDTNSVWQNMSWTAGYVNYFEASSPGNPNDPSSYSHVYNPPIDGPNAVAVVFNGVTFSEYYGLVSPFDDIPLELQFTTQTADDGLTVCIDSTWTPPGGTWKWAALAGNDTIPGWYQEPYCLTITDAPEELPDLEITSITADHEVVDPGESFLLNVQFTNVGTGHVIDETLDIWIYTSGGLTCTPEGYTATGGAYYFTNHYNDIAPGDTIDFQLGHPSSDGAVYEFQALVNGDSTIQESDYTNNCYDSAFVVTTNRIASGRISYFDWEHEEVLGVPYTAVEIRGSFPQLPALLDTTVTTDYSGSFYTIVPNDVQTITLRANLTQGGQGGVHVIELPVKPEDSLRCDFPSLDTSAVSLLYESPTFNQAEFSNMTWGPGEETDTTELAFASGCNAITALHEHQAFMLNSTNLNLYIDMPQWFRICSDPSFEDDDAWTCRSNREITLKAGPYIRYRGKVQRTVQHEIAHVVYMQLKPDVYFGGGTHYMCRPIPEPLAMAEGWADMIAALVPDQDSLAIWDYFCSVPDTQAIEFNTWWQDIYDTTLYQSFQLEGAIAGLLFDIVDHYAGGGDDDNLALPVSALFSLYADFELQPGEAYTFRSMSDSLVRGGVCNEVEIDEICSRMESDHFEDPSIRLALGGQCGGYTDVEESDEEEEQLPKSFTVSQNYPNPFNGTTHLLLGIPRAGELSVTVYNVLGQEVLSYLSDDLSPGEHDIAFDFSSFSSGVYLVRAQFEECAKNVKMLYLK